MRRITVIAIAAVLSAATAWGQEPGVAVVWDHDDPGVGFRVYLDEQVLGTTESRAYIIPRALFEDYRPHIIGVTAYWQTDPTIESAPATLAHAITPPIPPPVEPSEPRVCDPNPVRLSVGDWVRTVPPGSWGRVSYALIDSTAPVVRIIVRFGGVEQSRQTGEDLRTFGASYYRVPTVPGAYDLSVQAWDASGCQATIDRPMTVVVP